MIDNMKIYNAVRVVPQEAQKAISGGRLSGKTDINPMWRIRTLTEQFGVCGIGWKYTVDKLWTEQGGDKDIAAFATISLYVQDNGKWSEAIPGIGGSSFVTKESKGLYTSDECYKMALTDAISVACKALGIGADIYWSKDNTKYNKHTENKNTTEYLCNECKNAFQDFTYKGNQYTAKAAYDEAQKRGNGIALCKECRKKQEVKEQVTEC